MPTINKTITLTSEGASSGPNYAVYTSNDCITYSFLENVSLPTVGSFANVTIDSDTACLKLVNINEICTNEIITVFPTTTTTTLAPTTTTLSPTTTTLAPTTTTLAPTTTTLAPTTTTLAPTTTTLAPTTTTLAPTTTTLSPTTTTLAPTTTTLSPTTTTLAPTTTTVAPTTTTLAPTTTTLAPTTTTLAPTTTTLAPTTTTLSPTTTTLAPTTTTVAPTTTTLAPTTTTLAPTTTTLAPTTTTLSPTTSTTTIFVYKYTADIYICSNGQCIFLGELNVGTAFPLTIFRFYFDGTFNIQPTGTYVGDSYSFFTPLAEASWCNDLCIAPTTSTTTVAPTTSTTLVPTTSTTTTTLAPTTTTLAPTTTTLAPTTTTLAPTTTTLAPTTTTLAPTTSTTIIGTTTTLAPTTSTTLAPTTTTTLAPTTTTLAPTTSTTLAPTTTTVAPTTSTTLVPTTTINCEGGIVVTAAASQFTMGTTSATFSGTLLSLGTCGATNRGFVYSSVNSTPETLILGVANNSVRSEFNTTLGDYNLGVTNLTGCTKYYVRAFVRNANTNLTFYSDTITEVYTEGCATTTTTLAPTTTTTVSATTTGALISCGSQIEYEGSTVYPKNYTITLGAPTGTVTLSYDARSYPDRYLVLFDGSYVIDTGYKGSIDFAYGGSQRNVFTRDVRGRRDPITGNIYPFVGVNNSPDGFPIVTGPSSGTATFSKNTATTTAQVSVFAPQKNTIWTFSLSCPA